MSDVDLRLVINNVIVRGLNAGSTFFVLTLTTDIGVVSDIRKDFIKLMTLLSEIGDYEYFAMFTTEGNGVVHVLLKDCFLPRYWFETNWAFLHNSYIVRYEELRFDYKDYDGFDCKKAISVYLMKHFDADVFDGYMFSDGWRFFF